MYRAFAAIIILFTMAALYLSCNKDNGGSSVDCSTVSNKAFAADVNPIIQASCNIVGCHAAGSSNGPGALTNYSEVFNSRSRVRSAISSGSMPQGSSLSASQRNSIICWIDNGAPDN
jgi:uncharacterized membrane protein